MRDNGQGGYEEIQVKEGGWQGGSPTEDWCEVGRERREQDERKVAKRGYRGSGIEKTAEEK